MMKVRQNAEVVLKYSTVYPFRLHGNILLCVYCCHQDEDMDRFRQHMDETHQTFDVSTAFVHFGTKKHYLKVDCTNLRCRLCGDPCDRIEEIGRHLRDVHDVGDIDMNCAIGMQPYVIGRDKLHCVLCDKKFASINKLSRHTTSHYLKYNCEVCSRSYLNKEALAYHVRCSHSAGTHVCRGCWGEFLTLEEKREHAKVSKSCWPYCCVLCGERFVSWDRKHRHLENAHGHPKKTYACPDCDKVYKSRKQYYRHFTVNHTDDALVCACCGLKYPNQRMLDDHLLVHSDERNFQCNVCSKAFTKKDNLAQHMWIHSEKKRFNCVICEKQFGYKVTLNTHMKTNHPEEV